MHRFEIISALYYRPVNIRTITDMDISCNDTRIYTNWSEMTAYLPRQSHQNSAKNTLTTPAQYTKEKKKINSIVTALLSTGTIKIRMAPD